MEYDDPNEVLRLARLSVKEANMKAVRMQNQTTQQLVQRIKDLKYWSAEIDRELQDLNEENQDLNRCFKRLSRCTQSTSGAGKCNEACLAVRRKKVQIGDATNDRVDIELHKEKDLVADCHKQLKELSNVVEKQLDANEAAKKALMRDWTLKQEAIALDHRSAAMGTDAKMASRTPDGERLEYRDGAPLHRMSEYPEWVENTAVNLNQAARARVHSRKIAQKITQNAREMAQQMRSEAITVESLLKDSCKTWQEWRDSLHAQVGAKDKEIKTADLAISEIQHALKQKGSPLQVGAKDKEIKTADLAISEIQHALKQKGSPLQVGAKDKEIKTADLAISEIQHALKQKGSPLQVALSRQTQRGLRPGIELCNDKAQHALHAELMNLKSSLLSLEHQLDRARESRKKLEADRFKVHRKLEICEQNLAIDNEILRSIRTSYPQEIQLSGFLVSEN
ncbi:Tektin-4 [Toxocara canis]|uniref:Tektin n=1 Tax=Toxocara canis TaxID=6265 RepID=A0A0B2UMJ6_TOXCA|nr:Tektin-4 [Toxocara canis]